jgi:hypothetical protein
MAARPHGSFAKSGAPTVRRAISHCIQSPLAQTVTSCQSAHQTERVTAFPCLVPQRFATVFGGISRQVEKRLREVRLEPSGDLVIGKDHRIIH